MDIRITSALQAYNVQRTRPAAPVRSGKVAGAAEDRVSISAAAGDFATARKAAMASPDVRQDVVSSIRNMLANGQYNVSGTDVADRLFEGIA